jgi:hypothetical protein
VQHEKDIHLIIVSEDLSWFDHIHPEKNEDGSYSVTEIFPAGGNYHLFADYKPKEGNSIIDREDIKIEGPFPKAADFTKDKLNGNSGEYSFELTSTRKIVSGTEFQIIGTLRKAGKVMDAAKLENYLGAKAHIVAISLKGKKYIHLHPVVEDGTFKIHGKFPDAGVYRWWIQFSADGKLHTIDLTTIIAQGSESGESHDGHVH